MRWSRNKTHLLNNQSYELAPLTRRRDRCARPTLRGISARVTIGGTAHEHSLSRQRRGRDGARSQSEGPARGGHSPLCSGRAARALLVRLRRPILARRPGREDSAIGTWRNPRHPLHGDGSVGLVIGWTMAGALVHAGRSIDLRRRLRWCQIVAALSTVWFPLRNGTGHPSRSSCSASRTFARSSARTCRSLSRPRRRRSPTTRPGRDGCRPTRSAASRGRQSSSAPLSCSFSSRSRWSRWRGRSRA